MIQSIRLKNQITYGDLTAATLNTQLASGAGKGAFADICSDAGWLEACFLSPAGREAMLGSANALPILFASSTAKRLIWANKAVLDAVAATNAALTYIRGIAQQITITNDQPYTIQGRILVVESWASNSGHSLTISNQVGATQGEGRDVQYNLSSTRVTKLTTHLSPTIFTQSTGTLSTCLTIIFIDT